VAALVLAAAVTAVAGSLLGGRGADLHISMQRQDISQALVSTDERHIVVPAGVGGCVQRSMLTATETASRVTLAFTQFFWGDGCGVAAKLGTASVVLRDPLSGRSLLDRATGRPVSYVDARKLLRVTYLPNGYRFWRYFPGTSASWERQYTSADGKHQLLAIAQVPGHGAAGPAWPAQSRVVVRGQPATIRAGIDNAPPFGREISWSAGGYTLAVSTIMTTAGQQPLSVAELTKIATGLRP
jgi:hypothetical protein